MPCVGAVQGLFHGAALGCANDNSPFSDVFLEGQFLCLTTSHILNARVWIWLNNGLSII
jgi:hypothetical protein